MTAARQRTRRQRGRQPGPILARVPQLKLGLLVSAALLVGAAAVGLIFAGITGALGAAAGVALVAASFTASTLAIAWADSVNPQMVLPVGLTAYAMKFTLLGVVGASVGATGWSGLPALAGGIIVATLTWSTTHAVWVWRQKTYYVDP